MENESSTSVSSRFTYATARYKLLGILAILCPLLIYIGTSRHPIPDSAGDDVAVTPTDGFIQAAWVINVLGLILVGLYAAIGSEIYEEGTDKGLRLVCLLVVLFSIVYSVLCYAWTAEYEDSKDECLSKRIQALRHSSWYLLFATLVACLILVFFLRVAHYRCAKDKVLVNVLLIFPVLLVSYTAFAAFLNATEAQEYHIVAPEEN
jgi:cytochrome bd-type quinol oxidase subunit 2